MTKCSEEGRLSGLGWLDAEVVKFHFPAGSGLKVPHMGWNNIYNLNSAILTPELENQFVYFVHSYYVEVGEHTAATCDYINPFSAALHKDNFYATQFHPEKSQKVGARILENFINL